MRSALVELPRARRLPDWSSWQRLTAKAPPFLTPEFFTLASRFSDGTPVVVEAWGDGDGNDGDPMIGALPLVRRGDRLASLICEYTPGYDYVGSPDAVEAIWRALRDDDRWNELDLGKVPVTSPLATRLPSIAIADGCPVVTRLDSRHRYFALPGFESALPAKFRSNLARRARKAGELDLERIPIPDRAAFDDALAIEGMAWKSLAGTAISDDPKAVHLYRAFSRVLGRRGMGALYFLRAGGRRIAAMFAAEDGHTLYVLKNGYDPSHANVSPGHLLVWKVAADAEARGLQELNFLGADAEWKQAWTELVHEHVWMTIYRDGAAGLARYALRHLVRPHLPPQLRGGLREALPRSCQRADLIGAHTLVSRIRGRIEQGRELGAGAVDGLKRALWPGPESDPVGAPSELAPGSWVRVKDDAALREVLDEQGRTRGLRLTDAQRRTAGQVLRVAKHVRRVRDDDGRFRPVSRTVVLEAADGVRRGDGAGSLSPPMYRDEWLEPAEAPVRGPTERASVRHARVRGASEIRAGLDLRGRRDGLTFMPEMAQFAGKRFPIASKVTEVFEHGRQVPSRAAVYILDGLACSGAVVGDKGPCDRSCALMWHEDWLIVEP